MTSGADKAKNLETATRLVRRAAEHGCASVGLPENFSWMGAEPDRPSAAEPLDGPTLSRMAELARTHRIAVLAGSVLEPASEPGMLHNTSVLFGPDGARVGLYRKIHLFDVNIRDGATYRESAAVSPGREVVTAALPFATVGMSVCYDLRFPELYRALAQKGATLLTVPAAFTLMTGKDHWEVLLRARAIEDQCYVLAPAQWGQHSEKRLTYGHAMVVDPWGLVTARCSEGEGLAIASYDPALLEDVRTKLPALSHRRL